MLPKTYASRRIVPRRRGEDPLSAFVSTLGCSRSSYVEFVTDKGGETLKRCYAHASSESPAYRGGCSTTPWRAKGSALPTPVASIPAARPSAPYCAPLPSPGSSDNRRVRYSSAVAATGEHYCGTTKMILPTV